MLDLLNRSVRMIAADPNRIYHIKQPSLPQYRFEYHPRVKKVYVIRVGAVPEVGEAFAFEIENQGAAYNAVLYWLRGYKEAERAAQFPQLGVGQRG